MRTSLLKSFLTVLLFWWAVAFLVFGFMDPNLSVRVLVRLAEVLPWVEFEVPPGKLSVLDGWLVQRQVLAYWTAPVLAATFVCAAIGALATWLYAWRFLKAREVRAKGKGELFGVTITHGPLPMPMAASATPLELGSESDEDLARFTSVQRATLEQVLGVIAAKEEGAFVGQPDTTLLEIALSQASVALTDPDIGPVRAIFEAAKPMGNLVSFQKDLDGQWMQTRDPGREAAQLLSGLPGWRQLPAVERNALTMALRYSTQPERLPVMANDPELNGLVAALLTPYEVAEESDASTPEVADTSRKTPTAAPNPVTRPASEDSALQSSAASPSTAPAPAPAVAAPATPVAKPLAVETPAQAARTVFRVSHASKDHELGQESVHLFVFDAFVEMIPHITFQRQGLSRNVPADGWLKNRFHIYLIENRIREMLEKRLDPKVLAVANSIPRSTKPVALSVALLRGLESQGWLVREHDGRRVETDQALWSIVAGTNRFNGIIIAHVPEEHRSMLPVKDSHYDLTVVGPLFSQAGAFAVKPGDLPLDLLRPKGG